MSTFWNRSFSSVGLIAMKLWSQFTCRHLENFNVLHYISGTPFRYHNRPLGTGTHDPGVTSQKESRCSLTASATVSGRAFPLLFVQMRYGLLCGLWVWRRKPNRRPCCPPMSALTICFRLANRDHTFDRSAFESTFQRSFNISALAIRHKV